jgi:hypothetical protein
MASSSCSCSDAKLILLVEAFVHDAHLLRRILLIGLDMTR